MRKKNAELSRKAKTITRVLLFSSGAIEKSWLLNRMFSRSRLGSRANEKLAAASHLDFRTLISVVANLEGGVWMNVGSAVILPEIFLKALSAARNLGNRIDTFTTANLDMNQHYRPNTNVVGRPTKRGYSITGHHEIMIPLLRMGLICMAEEKG